jgi:carboxylesterase
MSMPKVIGFAQPRFFEGSNDEGVLLLHGLSSYPGVMDSLILALNELGYWVSAPRLPGHGTDGEDYVSVCAEDWLRHTSDSLLDLAGRCSIVHIVGISLGGVLALLLAAKYDIKSIVLLAPVVINTNRMILLAPLLRRFVRQLPGRFDPEGQDTKNPDIKYLAEEYWKWQWPGPAAELLKLQRRAKRAAKKVTACTMLIVSTADTTVPMGVKFLIEKLLGPHLSKTVVLEKSKHTLLTDCEKEKVEAEVVSWFEKPIWSSSPPA